MKPLNFCLDYLLEHLYQNRFRSEGQRTPFDIDHVVLPHLELTNHHEFIGLIDILIEDGCAIKLLDPVKPEQLDYYKDRILITPKGIHLLMSECGYTWRKRWDNVKKIANVLNIVILCIVTIVGVWISILQYRKEEKTIISQASVQDCERLFTQLQKSASCADSINHRLMKHDSVVKLVPWK